MKRINVRLVNNAEDFLEYTSKLTCITHKIFVKNYAAIHEIKPVLILNKSIYVTFTVQELSKCFMYIKQMLHVWLSLQLFLKKMLMLNCYLQTQTVLLMK